MKIYRKSQVEKDFVMDLKTSYSELHQEMLRAFNELKSRPPIDQTRAMFGKEDAYSFTLSGMVGGCEEGLDKLRALIKK